MIPNRWRLSAHCPKCGRTLWFARDMTSEERAHYLHLPPLAMECPRDGGVYAARRTMLMAGQWPELRPRARGLEANDNAAVTP